MNEIQVSVDAVDTLLLLKNGERKIPWAIANALNATARDIQTAERRRVNSIYHVRQKQFIERQVAIIKPFASAKKGIMYVVISVGQKDRLLLSRYEAGGIQTPKKGRNVAIPVLGGARPNITSPVPEQFYFKALQFRKVGKSGAGGLNASYRGLLHTFVIAGVGVFQRLGAGTDKLLYAFKRSVGIKPTLHFVDTARATTSQRFSGHMTKEINDAFTHAWFGG